MDDNTYYALQCLFMTIIIVGFPIAAGIGKRIAYGATTETEEKDE